MMSSKNFNDLITKKETKMGGVKKDGHESK